MNWDRLKLGNAPIVYQIDRQDREMGELEFSRYLTFNGP